MERYEESDEEKEANSLYLELVRAKAENKRLRELLCGSFWLIPELKDGDMVVYVGAHAVRARDGMVPVKVGLVEWDEEAIEKKLAEGESGASKEDALQEHDGQGGDDSAP